MIRLFGLHFVAPGIISKEQSKLYGKLFELRQTGDYDDFYNVSKEDVEGFLEPTKEFVQVLVGLMK